MIVISDNLTYCRTCEDNSYTKEGELVLDLTCYKGITGEVCDKIDRKYVGVDIKQW